MNFIKNILGYRLSTFGLVFLVICVILSIVEHGLMGGLVAAILVILVLLLGATQKEVNKMYEKPPVVAFEEDLHQW